MTPGPRHNQAPASGKLLVAAPDMSDPNFSNTVVLLIEHNHEGAVGVILNRPSMVPLHAVLDGWDDLLSSPEVLFQGGPVDTDGALALCLLQPGQSPMTGWRPIEGLGGRVGLIDLDSPPDEVGPLIADLRVFAGYAGWGTDQIENEIAEQVWYVVPGQSADAFCEEPDGLRRAVLRRQPGELAWVSTRPVDPDLN